MLCALIMAGGKGTRFWPKSTEEKPKQFINLVGDKTMIQHTVDRVLPLISIDRIFVCTSSNYLDIVKEQLPNLPEENIILEPCMRNTAPCILLSSLYIKKKYNNANIVVLPSDHIIRNTIKFRNIIEMADNKLNESSDGIITVGIVPNRPETGYGYIKVSEANDIFSTNICSVDEFVEKPNLELAKKYITESNYLWNAGIFVFNSNYILNEFKKHMLNTYNLLSELPDGYEEMNSVLEEKYLMCEKISFDYGIMEKSSPIYVIPAEFGWDDVGTWNAVERYIEKSDDNNVIKGDVLIDNGRNNIVYGAEKKIIISNLDNIFCIDSDDVIIIGNRNNIDDVHMYGKVDKN